MPHNWKEQFGIIMPSSSSKISRVLLFLCMLSLFSISAEAITTYRYHICANSSLYTPNGTYQSNLDILFSSLSSNASRSSGFYNTTAGRNTPDAAYGLFLCRGDVAVDLCRECVDAASTEILRRCPMDKRAYMWFDECMLRYTDQSIFSRLADTPSLGLWNSQNITDPSRFMELMMETMNGLVTRAAVTDGSGKKFATEDANFTSFQRLYTLAQCTPDLTQADCNRCLQVAIAQLPSCCDGKKGGRVLTPSCNVRYETYPFYQNAVAAPPPTPIITFSPPPPTIPIASPEGNGKLSTQTIVAIVVSGSFSVMLLSIGCCFLVRKARKKYDAIAEDNVGNEITTVQSLQFDLRTIGAATKNFSDDNKIGEGGFGSVYKGILPNGQEIAVKRLARGSGQGGEEFKNEVVLVAKLQHRNLVRLLGFCLEGEEKILIYEFVTNKSLDCFLFDPKKQRQLDWSRRYKIMGGIARGILYLHEDSRLRIIHRDLKASNILLDEDMNPKISDFGMARIFGVDQTQANTNRVVGTFGYMSPEYAMHGHFSVKSDVFSFGVLVLEIISGKKNSNFHQSDRAEDLLSYTWRLWREGTPLELKDPTLGNSYSRNELLRCINIGLLCVQEDVDARPSMSSVVVMLNSFSVTLPLPRQPPFLAGSRTESQIPQGLLSDQSTTKSIPLSVNEASITELYPR